MDKLNATKCKVLSIVKENKDVILKKANEIKSEIDNLEPFETQFSDSFKIIVNFKFYMSLIDGKIFAFVTNTSSMQTCCICGAKPEEMNNEKKYGR